MKLLHFSLAEDSDQREREFHMNHSATPRVNEDLEMVFFVSKAVAIIILYNLRNGMAQE